MKETQSISECTKATLQMCKGQRLFKKQSKLSKTTDGVLSTFKSGLAKS